MKVDWTHQDHSPIRRASCLSLKIAVTSSHSGVNSWATRGSLPPDFIVFPPPHLNQPRRCKPPQAPSCNHGLARCVVEPPSLKLLGCSLGADRIDSDASKRWVVGRSHQRAAPTGRRPERGSPQTSRLVLSSLQETGESCPRSLVARNSNQRLSC
jgi:hypothetical protein